MVTQEQVMEKEKRKRGTVKNSLRPTPKTELLNGATTLHLLLAKALLGFLSQRAGPTSMAPSLEAAVPGYITSPRTQQSESAGHVARARQRPFPAEMSAVRVSFPPEQERERGREESPSLQPC